MEFSRIFRSLVDVNRFLILVEFGRILILIESGGFLRRKVGISKNLRIVDLSRFPKF